MEFILIGLISAINMIVIKVKLEKKRFEDAIFDASLMALLAFMFSGSYGGMVVAMVSSLAVSLYLLVSPPKFTAAIVSKFRTEIDEAMRINEIGKYEKKPKKDNSNSFK